ncbi:MAG: RNA methyltransferase [Ferruginibacter sp.]|nr:RNA methyltransferase [Ferruginibacter sp.]
MLTKSVIKYIQSLQQKKYRDVHHAFVAEGPKVVLDLIASSFSNVKEVYAIESWLEEINPSLLNSIRDKLYLVKSHELEKISQYTTPNKVVGIFSKFKSDNQISLKNSSSLLLDSIQDPGNLGTIIRTADWFGIKNIICTPDTADMYNSKVVQSTMASLANVNIIYDDLLKWIHAPKTIPVISAVLGGDPLSSFTDKGHFMLVIGNESGGIRSEIIQASDKKLTIPVFGNAESLNAAVATGIFLHYLKS